MHKPATHMAQLRIGCRLVVGCGPQLGTLAVSNISMFWELMLFWKMYFIEKVAIIQHLAYVVPSKKQNISFLTTDVCSLYGKNA